MPSILERAIILLLILLGVSAFIYFARWWVGPHHALNPWLFGLLTCAAWYAGLRSLVNWYAYAYIAAPHARATSPDTTSAVLTTACPGEPLGMIREALEHIVAIGHPHGSYLLDEANSPELRTLCRRLGVAHITRERKAQAKAGNVNHALPWIREEFITIFDPDHRPAPEFLDRVLGHFQDPGVGIVQTVQAYYNQDEGLVARGAAEQTYGFYGPVLMGMYGAGSSLVIGTGCTFRRAALLDIGGHQAGLAEDLHTSMALHARGWRSVYVPEILARGLVPADILAYAKQQIKWSKGLFDLLLTRMPRLLGGWTWHQRISYFMIGTYYLLGLATAINMALPVLFLWTGVLPAAMDLLDYVYHYTPFLLVVLLMHLWSARWFRDPAERHPRWRGALLLLCCWPIFIWGLVLSLGRVNVPYLPTPKTGERVRAPLLALPHLLLIALTLEGWVLAWQREGLSTAFLGMGLFAAINLGINAFGLALFMGWIGQPRAAILRPPDWDRPIEKQPFGTVPEYSPASEM